MGYPLSRLLRRIDKKMKESYQYLFVVAVGSILTLLGVVVQPLFASPISWSNINCVNLAVVWARFIYAAPLIGLFVAVAIFIVTQIKRVDNEKDNKFRESLKEVLKGSFKEALKEDREEERRERIRKAGDW
jgi:hypothetical protein